MPYGIYCIILLEFDLERRSRRMIWAETLRPSQSLNSSKSDLCKAKLSQED